MVHIAVFIVSSVVYLKCGCGIFCEDRCAHEFDMFAPLRSDQFCAAGEFTCTAHLGPVGCQVVY